MSAGAKHRKSLRTGTFIAGVVTTAVTLAACVPITTTPPPTSNPSAPLVLRVSASPAMYPAFDPGISDYVVRCTASPVALTVEAPKGTTVTVSGFAPIRGARRTLQIPRTTGQRFFFATKVDGQPTRHHSARCLPVDFLTWTTIRSGSTESQWFLTTTGPLVSQNYAAIFDTNGVPVWWAEKKASVLTTLLPDRTMLQLDSAGGPVEHRSLEWTMLGSISTAPDETDLHDALLLGNGNYLVVANPTTTVDLSEWGEGPCMPDPAAAPLLDHELREVEPDGDVIWSWKASDPGHIDVASESSAQWRTASTRAAVAGQPCDALHFNSVEETPDGYLVSMRHMDAVYKISKATGDIVWKLGGTPTDKSLTIVENTALADSLVPFSGQHDARLDPDGTVSLHDNGSDGDPTVPPDARAPRAVRYSIDEGARTAMLVESMSNPGVTASGCCGSARRLAGGSWVIGWGGSTVARFTEQAPDGTVVFEITFAGNNVMYRVMPVLPGQLARDTLIAAMDARYP